MQHHGEILIRFPVEQGRETEAYEALTYAAKAASKIVKEISERGIAGATQTHRIYAHEPVHTAEAKAEKPVAKAVA